MTQITLHYQAVEARHMQIILDDATIFDETVEPLAIRPPLAFSYEVSTSGAHQLTCKDVTNALDMEQDFSTPETADVILFIEEDVNENQITVSEEPVGFK